MLEVYYQPEVLKEDGTYDCPYGMYSWEVFHTIEDATKWMSECGYKEYRVVQYSGDDIEDHEYIGSLSV